MLEKLLILRKQYSSVVRYSLNRLYDEYSEKDIRNSLPNLNNIHELDAWIKQCAILEAKGLKERNGSNKIIFGGKSNFIKRCKNKITKEEYNEKRLLPLTIYGEKVYGNRKFKLDIINNNQIIFKNNRNEHFILKLPKLRENYRKLLYKLEEINESEGLTYQIKLDDKYIYFSFEPVKEENNLIETNYMGIDLNPEFIGISIKNDDGILHTECFSLKKIIKRIKDLNVTSNNKDLKYLNNKLDYEILEISKQISKLSLKYYCKFIFIEDLTFKNVSKGKVFNRLVKNLWKRELFINNLEKRVKINGQKIYKINPAYSSIIGNCQHDFVDPINASLEIARRGYEIIIKKSKKFYPEFNLKDSLKHQWKEMFNDGIGGWKDLFGLIKSSKMRYRVSTLEDVVLRKFNSKKSLVSYVSNIKY
jgi:IS605 OrfB family transposase